MKIRNWLTMALVALLVAFLPASIASAKLFPTDLSGDGVDDTSVTTGGGNGSAGPGDGGSGGTGGGGGSDGGGSTTTGPAGVSVPRVMLTEFVTNPPVVMAGTTFEVMFTLQNMSARTRVDNLKVTISGEGFLPVGGSSSTYISGIRAEHSISRSMAFQTLPTMEERPYEMTLTVEYEDTQFNAYQTQETVAVVVKQNVRADTTTPQVNPQAVMAGQETSVTFSVNNLGKNKLFNAKAAVKEGQPVTGGEVFIGNVEPGAAGQVEMVLTPMEELAEPVVVVISYEDANGTAATMEKEVQLAVMPMMTEEEMYPPMEEEPMPEEQGLDPMTLGIIGGSLLLALIVLGLVIRSHRRRRRQKDLDSDMTFLDDPLVPSDV